MQKIFKKTFVLQPSSKKMQKQMCVLQRIKKKANSNSFLQKNLENKIRKMDIVQQQCKKKLQKKFLAAINLKKQASKNFHEKKFVSAKLKIFIKTIFVLIFFPYLAQIQILSGPKTWANGVKLVNLDIGLEAIRFSVWIFLRKASPVIGF